eukprot:3783423-Amphidinium_carterae.1
MISHLLGRQSRRHWSATQHVPYACGSSFANKRGWEPHDSCGLVDASNRFTRLKVYEDQHLFTSVNEFGKAVQERKIRMVEKVDSEHQRALTHPASK